MAWMEAFGLAFPFAGGLLGAFAAPLLRDRYRRSTAKKDDLEQQLLAMKKDLRFVFGVVNLVIKNETGRDDNEHKSAIRSALRNLFSVETHTRIEKATDLGEHFFIDLLSVWLLAQEFVGRESDGERTKAFNSLSHQYNTTREMFAKLYNDKIGDTFLIARGFDETYNNAKLEYSAYRLRQFLADPEQRKREFDAEREARRDDPT